MRVYFPAVSSDLLADDVSPRLAFTALAARDASGEELELLEDDAQTEAALASLVALRQSEGQALRRIVLAADIDTETPSGCGVVTLGERGTQWSKVAAILIDAPQARDAVLAVIEAKEQEEADEAVAALWEHALEWFDITEREELARALIREK